MPLMCQVTCLTELPSMKVPPKRKGNFLLLGRLQLFKPPLNESPSEKEGKCGAEAAAKARPGNSLNESPSEKEGKFGCR